MSRLGTLRLALLALAFVGCINPGPRKAWEKPPPPAHEAAVVESGAFHRSTLANGVRVLALEDPRLPRVVVGATFRRGAGAVPPARSGLAVYTASLMERGAGDRDALALAQAVDEIGAAMSVTTGWDSTSVTLSGLSRDLDRLVEVLTDLVLRPRLDAGEALRVRAEQLARLGQARDDPGTVVGWAAGQTLYPDHRYGRPLSGTPETVSRLDSAAARDFHARVFVPGNAILFASGDIRAADWQRRVSAAFEGWRPGSEPVEAPVPPAPTPDRKSV
ncbi:MAG: pitrilysin family protein, partial [Myxococcota bacterium]